MSAPKIFGPGEPARYRIVFQEHLDAGWSEWFDGLEMAYDARKRTMLTGPVADQSALLGLLLKVHHLGLSLVSFQREQSGSRANKPSNRP